MKNDIELLELLFEQGTVPDNAAKVKGGIAYYRTKTVWAGDMAYVRVYPVWDTNPTNQIRRIIKSVSRESQTALNERNRRERFEQIINANFGDGDIFITLTYADDEQPETEERARKDLRNFLKRVKRIYDKRGKELKYAYCMETTSSEERGTRYHFHMVMTAGDREEIERAWKRGYANTRRCVADKTGLAGIANYMTKQKRNRNARRWAVSQNCERPAESYANHKISTTQAMRIEGAIEEYGRGVFEKKYPGYELSGEIVARRSEWVNGIYITARMRRKRQ